MLPRAKKNALRRLMADWREMDDSAGEFAELSGGPLAVLKRRLGGDDEEEIAPDDESGSLDDWFQWHLSLRAPIDSPYAGVELHIALQFPDEYPRRPPIAYLCTDLTHAYVFERWICLDLLAEHIADAPDVGDEVLVTLPAAVGVTKKPARVCARRVAPRRMRSGEEAFVYDVRLAGGAGGGEHVRGLDASAVEPSRRATGWSAAYSASSVAMQLGAFLFDASLVSQAPDDVARTRAAAGAFACDRAREFEVVPTQGRATPVSATCLLRPCGCGRRHASGLGAATGDGAVVQPRHVVFVLDVSYSMSGERLAAAVSSLRDLYCNLRPRDLVSLVRFDHRSTVVFRERCRLLHDDAIRAAIGAARVSGATAFYDSLIDAATLLRPELGRAQHRSIIALTDGYDNSSNHTCRDAARAVGAADATLFVIGVGELSNRREIEACCAATDGGGFLHVATGPGEGDRIQAAYKGVATVMHSQSKDAERLRARAHALRRREGMRVANIKAAAANAVSKAATTAVSSERAVPPPLSPPPAARHGGDDKALHGTVKAVRRISGAAEVRTCNRSQPALITVDRSCSMTCEPLGRMDLRSLVSFFLPHLLSLLCHCSQVELDSPSAARAGLSLVVIPRWERLSAARLRGAEPAAAARAADDIAVGALIGPMWIARRDERGALGTLRSPPRARTDSRQSARAAAVAAAAAPVVVKPGAKLTGVVVWADADAAGVRVAPRTLAVLDVRRERAAAARTRLPHVWELSKLTPVGSSVEVRCVGVATAAAAGGAAERVPAELLRRRTLATAPGAVRDDATLADGDDLHETVGVLGPLNEYLTLDVLSFLGGSGARDCDALRALERASLRLERLVDVARARRAAQSEVRCCFWRTPMKEETLGLGINLTRHAGGLSREVASAEAVVPDLISWRAFSHGSGGGVRQNSWNETFTHFVPLYFEAAGRGGHGARAVPLARRCLSSLLLDGDAARVDSLITAHETRAACELMLTALCKLLNGMVVQMVGGEMHESIAALQGYFGVIHLLLGIAEVHPELLAVAKERVDSFLDGGATNNADVAAPASPAEALPPTCSVATTTPSEAAAAVPASVPGARLATASPASRHKSAVPSLGELLPLALLAGRPWAEVVVPFLEEAFVRNARWAIKRHPELADVKEELRRGELVSPRRLALSLEAGAVSLRLFAFHCVCLELLCDELQPLHHRSAMASEMPSKGPPLPPAPAALKAHLDRYFGRPTQRTLLKLQRATSRIKNLASWGPSSIACGCRHRQPGTFLSGYAAAC